MVLRTRVIRGEKRIPAEEYSELLRQARGKKLRSFDFGSAGVEQQFPAIHAWIKNGTASTLSEFAVLALDSPLITRTQNAAAFRSSFTFNGIAPSTSTPHYGKFAVLQEPAKPGRIVRGIIAGATWAKLNIADSDDVAAEITNNQTAYLTTNMHGSARILWKESGTGTDKWGLVVLGSWVSMMLGKTDSSINAGASGTVSVWAGAEGSEVDTGVNVTAYNRFANVSSGKWVMVASVLGRLYLIAAQC